MENQKVNLEKIKLTPELVECIKELQAGSLPNYKLENCWLNQLIEGLTNLNDKIVKYYLSDPLLFNPVDVLESLTDIQIIKDTLLKLAAPSKKQNHDS